MTFKRAIVTAVGPLRIMIDGDTGAIPFTPESLIDPATLAVGDVVHAKLSGNLLIVLGRSGGLGLLSGRNLFINSNFMVNQRGAVSGALIATLAYFLDRWFNAGGGTTTTTWADSGGVRTITLGDGTGLRYADQIVEASTLPAGTYTASWEGTAELYIFVKNPVYADSPVTFTTDGTADVKFQFHGNGDTLRNVKLERGSVATPYQPPTYDDNLRACMRYYQRFSGGNGVRFANGFFDSTTGFRMTVPLFVQLRSTTPTLTYSSLSIYDGATIFAITALVTGGSGVPIVNVAWLSATVSGATAYRPAEVFGNSAASFIALDAEL